MCPKNTSFWAGLSYFLIKLFSNYPHSFYIICHNLIPFFGSIPRTPCTLRHFIPVHTQTRAGWLAQVALCPLPYFCSEDYYYIWKSMFLGAADHALPSPTQDCSITSPESRAANHTVVPPLFSCSQCKHWGPQWLVQDPSARNSCPDRLLKCINASKMDTIVTQPQLWCQDKTNVSIRWQQAEILK